MNSLLPVGTLLFILSLLTSTHFTEKESFSYPPQLSFQELSKWMSQAPENHPRLLASGDEFRNLKQIIETDPTAKMLADAVLSEARYLLDIPPIDRQLVGRRLLGQSRRCLKRVLILAMAFHLSDDSRFVQRCRQEMLAAARFEDWNPSHFLDTAEMACALAFGYDWLFHQLDPNSREEIRKAIVEKSLALQFDTEPRWWIQSENNWGQVCHGGLTAGALAVMEHEPELALRTVHSALRNVTYSMDVYRPNGSYPEGPAYWSYGTSFNVLLIALLESVLGSDFGLSQAPGFGQTGGYLNLVTGPSGKTFNYADGGSGRGPNSVLFWFARRYDRPDWLAGEEDRIRSVVEKLSPSTAAGQSGRLLPLALFWLPVEKSSEQKSPLHWNGRGETPVTIHRSSWSGPERTFVGVKAGSPSANHGNMDIGSFVMDADGTRWALDLGAEGYHGIESRGMNLWSREQGSDRWKIFRQQNFGHNTLVIDRQLQVAAGFGKVVGFSDDPRFAHTVVDMSEVYKGQATQVARGVALLPSREVLVQDELTGVQPGTRVRWSMITRGIPAAAGSSSIELRQDSKRLSLNILSPRTSRWRVVNTEIPRNEWDSPNPGTCSVTFEAVALESGRIELIVLLTPGSVGSSLKGTLQLKPLKSWGE